MYKLQSYYSIRLSTRLCPPPVTSDKQNKDWHFHSVTFQQYPLYYSVFPYISLRKFIL